MTNQTNNYRLSSRQAPRPVQHAVGFAARFEAMSRAEAINTYRRIANAGGTGWERGFNYYVYQEVSFLIEEGEWEAPSLEEAAEATIQPTGHLVDQVEIPEGASEPEEERQSRPAPSQRVIEASLEAGRPRVAAEPTNNLAYVWLTPAQVGTLRRAVQAVRERQARRRQASRRQVRRVRNPAMMMALRDIVLSLV